MESLDKWIEYAGSRGLTIKEYPLQHSDGMIYGSVIALRSGMTEPEKTCVLVEEIGHHELTVGDILDQTDTRNRKQECKARRWSFNHQLRQSDLIEAVRQGYVTSFDIAEHLGITEQFLAKAIADFRKQYGVGVFVDGYFIQYEPYLAVFDLWEYGASCI